MNASFNALRPRLSPASSSPAFPAPHDWPRSLVTHHDGLALGWQGPAWTWLVLNQHGLVPFEAEYLTAIERRLVSECQRPVPNRYSHLIGAAGAVLLSARIGSKKLLNRHLKRWKAAAEKGSETDLMFGASGALLAACELEGIMPGFISGGFMHMIIKKAISGLERILQNGTTRRVPLGLSHGAAGHLLALEAAAYRFSCHFDPGLSERTLDLLNREQICIVERAGSHQSSASIWPAFSGTQMIKLQSWCHGAPGIALAFLRMSEIRRTAAYREIAIRALNAIPLVSGGSGSFCCGSSGRAHILLEGYRILKKRKWLIEAKKSFRKSEDAPGYRRKYQKSFHQGIVSEIYFYHRTQNPALPLPGCVI